MKYVNKNSKATFILHLLLIGTLAHTQELKEKQLHTLSSLGLPYHIFERTNENINADFRNILQLEKRRKGQKIAGCLLSSVGLAEVGFGAKTLSDNNSAMWKAENDHYESDRGAEARFSWNSAIGSSLILVGSVQIAVSVFPCSSSPIRKKESEINYFPSLE